MSLNAALSAVPTLLIIWASLVACFVALLTYRGQLTRYEDAELFLNEQHPDLEQHQSDIVRRVNKVQPVRAVLRRRCRPGDCGHRDDLGGGCDPHPARNAFALVALAQRSLSRCVMATLS